MNLILFRLFLVLCIQLYLIPFCYSQRTVSPASSIKNAYAGLFLEQLPYSRGKEYLRYGFNIEKGIPYFKSDSLTPGSLVYNGCRYDNVPLMLDQVTDELITIDVTRKHLIRLFKPQIPFFTINNAEFILVPDTVQTIQSGWWQVLRSGTTLCLKKEVKEILDEVKMEEQLKKVLRTKPYYCIRHNDRFYPVKTAASVTALFKDREQEIKAFLKDNKARFRKADIADVLPEIAAYYDTLTGNQ